MSEVTAFQANYHPLLGHLMDQMGFVKIIDEMVDPSNTQADASSGTVVAGLIHNILSPQTIRLYRLNEFWEDKALPLWFPWQPDLTAAAINEDRAGRVLDRLYEAGPQKVFSAVSQCVIARYALDIHKIHLDTTSKSFYGTYPDQVAGAGPELKHGYSKDRHPELLQLLFGVGVGTDGVPVIGDVTSGNETDMEFNGYWVTQIRRQLGLGNYGFLLYVADSAATTEENLRLMRLFHIDFISRLPERFDLAEQLMRQAPEDRCQWDQIGRIGSGKKSANYQVWEIEAELAGTLYRFLVVESDHLKQQHLSTLQRTLDRQGEALKKGLTKLSAKPFDSENDAHTAIALFAAKHPSPYYHLSWQVETCQGLAPRHKRGRPSKDEVRQTITRYRLAVTVRPNEEAIAAERCLCGLFVLITSLRDRLAYPARTILAEYKEQHVAERVFSFIKDPTWVGAFCLKKPERIVALGYVLLMASMVYTLLERQVRQALTKPEERLVLGLDNRPTSRPSAWAILTILSAILIIAERQVDQWVFHPARKLTDNQERILTLAGFGPHIYYWQGALPITNFARAPA